MRDEISVHKIVSMLSFIFVIVLLFTPVLVFKNEIYAAIYPQVSVDSTEKVYFRTLDVLFPKDRTSIYTAVSENLPILENLPSSQQVPLTNNDYFSISDHSARLFVNSVNIEGPIVGGTTDAAMKKGFWHYPTSSASFKYGNTVLIGHRYYKMPPHKDTFFNLDKISVGDDVKISTDSGELEYVVIEKKIINVSDTWILEHSDEPTLTLITCHPLWTSKQRLVIISRLVKSSVNL